MKYRITTTFEIDDQVETDLPLEAYKEIILEQFSEEPEMLFDAAQNIHTHLTFLKED